MRSGIQYVLLVRLLVKVRWVKVRWVKVRWVKVDKEDAAIQIAASAR